MLIITCQSRSSRPCHVYVDAFPHRDLSFIFSILLLLKFFLGPMPGQVCGIFSDIIEISDGSSPSFHILITIPSVIKSCFWYRSFLLPFLLLPPRTERCHPYSTRPNPGIADPCKEDDMMRHPVAFTWQEASSAAEACLVTCGLGTSVPSLPQATSTMIGPLTACPQPLADKHNTRHRIPFS